MVGHAAPAAGHVAPAAANASPFAKLTAAFTQIVSDPEVLPTWTRGCEAWERWENSEDLSKREVAVSTQVEAIFTCAYLIQWNADTFSTRQWRDFAGALAATSQGHITAENLIESIDGWDEELEDEDDDSWEAFVEWIAETLPEPALRRAAYQFAAASAALDGRRSSDDVEVLDELAELLEISSGDARAIQSQLAQQLA